MTAQTPRKLTVHHTAVRQKPDVSLGQKLRAMQRFSQSEERLADGRLKPAWADVPYHFYIDVHGEVAEGRPVDFAGDTNTNYDPTGHIGIAMEGNFEVETPSEAQIGALTALLSQLGKTHGLTVADIAWHQTYAATACPGKSLIAVLPSIAAATDLPAG